MKKILVILALIFSISASSQKVDTASSKYFLVFRIPATVFDSDAYVVVTEDLPKALIYVRKIVDSTAELSDFEDNQGIVFTNGTLPPVLWIPKKPSNYYELSILNHEVFHLVSTILRGRNIQLSDETEEVYAYMIGFYSKTIYLNFSR